MEEFYEILVRGSGSGGRRKEGGLLGMQTLNSWEQASAAETWLLYQQQRKKNSYLKGAVQQFFSSDPFCSQNMIGASAMKDPGIGIVPQMKGIKESVIGK